MKLHVSQLLRRAIMACYATASLLTPTLGTASLAAAGYLFAAGQAQATDYTAKAGGPFTYYTTDPDTTVALTATGVNAAGNKLVYDDVAGYLYAGTYEIKADIHIGSAGLTINDGYQKTTMTISGDLTGDGDIIYQSSKGSNGTTYAFTGDVSGFTGDLIFTGNSAAGLSLELRHAGDTAMALHSSEIKAHNRVVFNGKYNLQAAEGSTATLHQISARTVALRDSLTLSIDTKITGTLRFEGSGAIGGSSKLYLAGSTKLEFSADSIMQHYVDGAVSYDIGKNVYVEGTAGSYNQLSTASLSNMLDSSLAAGSSYDASTGLLTINASSLLTTYSDPSLTWAASSFTTPVVCFDSVTAATLAEDVAMAGIIVAKDAQLTLAIDDANIKLDCEAISVEGAMTVDISATPTTTFSADLSGTGDMHLKKAGHYVCNVSGSLGGFKGTLYLEGDNSTDIEGTRFNFTTNQPGSGVTMVLDHANFYYTGSGRIDWGSGIVVNNSNWLNGNGNQVIYLSGALSGAGTLYSCTNTHNIFTGDLTGFAGTLAERSSSNFQARWYLGADADSPTAGYSHAAANGGNIFYDYEAANAGLAEGEPLATPATLTAKNGSSFIDVKYSNAELKFNAVAAGSINLNWKGSGKLILTEANTTTGSLTVSEAGAVVQLGDAAHKAEWKGSKLLGSGTLLIVNGTLASGITDKAETAAIGIATLAGADAAHASTVDLGGTAGALITGGVSTALYSSITGVTGDITATATNKVELVLDSRMLSADGTGAACAIGGQRAGLMSMSSEHLAITLDADSIVADLMEARSTGEAGTVSRQLHLVSGELCLVGSDGTRYKNGDSLAAGSTALDGYISLLGNLGYNVTGLGQGTMILTTNDKEISYIVDGQLTKDTADFAAESISTYDSTLITAGSGLHITLAEGESATLNNVLAATGGTLTASTASGKATVKLNHEAGYENGTNKLGISGGAGVIYEKAGDGALTLGGTVDVEDTLRISAGSLDVAGLDASIGTADVAAGMLKVSGSGASIGTLALNGGDAEVSGSGASIGTLALKGGDVEVSGSGAEVTALVLTKGTLTTSAAQVSLGDVSLMGEAAGDAVWEVEESIAASTLSDSAQGGSINIAEGKVLTVGNGSQTELDATAIGGKGTLKIADNTSLLLKQLNGAALDLGTQEATTLELLGGASTVAALEGSGTVSGGVLTVEGSRAGYFSGKLDQVQLTVQGTQQQFSAIDGTGSSLTLEGTTSFDLDIPGHTLTLESLTFASSSATTFNISNPMLKAAPVAVELTNITVNDGAAITFAAEGPAIMKDTALELDADVTASGKLLDGYAVALSGSAFDRITDAQLRMDGNRLVLFLTASRVNDFMKVTSSSVSAAGATLLWEVDTSLLPADSDLAQAYESVNEDVHMARIEAADKALAAVAGASTATIGAAFSADMERQLRAIRNRTTTMGAAQGVWNADLPYFNAWINGEGDYRKVDADGYLPGYELTSWGGTVGFDVDCSNNFTAGLAFTAMYGDLEAESADLAEGDLDTYYATAFARVSSGRWVHSFVGSFGLMSATLDRTVNYGTGSYRTQGETEGTGVGLLYEVGYTIPLDEDAGITLQPVANVAWRHVSVDAYDEEGSDAGLAVGEQEYNTLTFGLGARMQAVVGESIYNRKSILELRALLKLDAGDLEGGAEVAFLGNRTTAEVNTAELGAVGAELGLGLTVPIDPEHSSIFMDVSAELRSGATSANAAAGYRVNF